MTAAQSGALLRLCGKLKLIKLEIIKMQQVAGSYIMRICATLIAGLLLAGCASMVSERTTVVTPDGDEVDSAVAREAGGERLICSREAVVGTRLPKRRTCRTAAEWEKIGEQSREEVDRAQRGTLPNAAQDGT